MSDASFTLAVFYVMNILAFAFFAWDKHLAIYGRRRIPELALLLLSAAGGAFGALCSMLFFRHKTRHPKFYICVPLFLLLQVVIYVIIVLT